MWIVTFGIDCQRVKSGLDRVKCEMKKVTMGFALEQYIPKVLVWFGLIHYSAFSAAKAM